MQRLVAVAGFAAAVFLTPPPAAAQRPASCEPVPNRPLEVSARIDVPPLRIDRSQSKRQLTDAGLHAQGRTRVGETRYALTLRTNTGYATRSQRTGACVWIEKVEVIVGFPAVDVRIASDYATTSCAYRSILAHENRHVAIARDHVTRYAPRFRQALDSLSIPTGRAPWATAALSDTQRQVEAELKRLLAPTFDQLWAEMKNAQAAIDTPEAYAAEQRECDDW